MSFGIRILNMWWPKSTYTIKMLKMGATWNSTFKEENQEEI